MTTNNNNDNNNDNDNDDNNVEQQFCVTAPKDDQAEVFPLPSTTTDSKQ